MSTIPGMALTAHDRCDVKECGAQAYVAVRYITGGLMFCAHHYTVSETLIQASVESSMGVIHDERAKLYATTKLDVSA